MNDVESLKKSLYLAESYAIFLKKEINKHDNGITDNSTCQCIIKRTDVKGMCIIYPRYDCPIHYEYHNLPKEQTK